MPANIVDPNGNHAGCLSVYRHGSSIFLKFVRQLTSFATTFGFGLLRFIFTLTRATWVSFPDCFDTTRLLQEEAEAEAARYIRKPPYSDDQDEKSLAGCVGFASVHGMVGCHQAVKPCQNARIIGRFLPQEGCTRNPNDTGAVPRNVVHRVGCHHGQGG